MELEDAIIMTVPYKGKDLKDVYFPLNGPYSCEICAKIVETNLDFFNHLKGRHLEEADEDVMETMENYLKLENLLPF